MIMITGKFDIDPAQRAAFLGFAQDWVAHERGQAGCLGFNIYEDVSAANSFLMLEQWDDEDALDAAAESESSEANEERLNSFIVGEPTFEQFEF